MKKVPAVLALALFVLAGAAVAQYQYTPPPLKTYELAKDEVRKLGATTVMISTKFGDITVKFFPDTAPQHVKNFVELAKAGVYDKTVFHRVIRGFMIQGGDPVSKDPARERAYGTGNPGHRIKAEFSSRPHKRGTLSMARSQDPNSAGSQFFICVADRQHLDGQYSVFGEVVSGMDVVDKIVALQAPGTERPRERVEMTMKVVEGK